MAKKTLKTRIIQKHDIEANWLLATNFTPMNGEIIIYDEDGNYNYKRVKIGDGTTNVNALPFQVTPEDIPTEWSDFGESVGDIILPETQYENDFFNGVGTVYSDIEFLKAINIGSSYLINFNSTKYNCECIMADENTPFNGVTYIGNLVIQAMLFGMTKEDAIAAGMNDTGEPFYIVINDEGMLDSLNTTDESSILTISIHEYELNKIDEQFIPSTIARKEYVDTALENKANKEDIVQSDWNENNQESNSFIQNKPFGEVLTETTITEITYDGTPTDKNVEINMYGISMYFSKIADYFIPRENLLGGTVKFSVGTITTEEEIITEDNCVYGVEDDTGEENQSCILLDPICWFIDDNAVGKSINGGFIFPEKGLYALNDNNSNTFGEVNEIKLTLSTPYTTTAIVINKIPEKYITYKNPSWSQVENKPFAMGQYYKYFNIDESITIAGEQVSWYYEISQTLWYLLLNYQKLIEDNNTILKIENCNIEIKEEDSGKIIFTIVNFENTQKYKEIQEGPWGSPYYTLTSDLYVNKHKPAAYVRIGVGDEVMPDDNDTIGSVNASGSFKTFQQQEINEMYIPNIFAKTSDIPEVANADWDVNDETSAAYVKNRPFYDSRVEVVKTITWDGNTEGKEFVDVSGDGSALLVKVSDEAPIMEELYGGSLTINDGAVINIEEGVLAETDDLYGDENSLFIVALKDTTLDNLNFKKGVYFIGIPSENTYVQSLEYTSQEGELVKLEEKYLPDSTLVQSDWSQNDEISLDYIKNRTHYEYNESKLEMIITSDQFSYSTSNTVNFYAYQTSIDTEVNVGDVITFEYGDKSYEWIGVEYTEEGQTAITFGTPYEDFLNGNEAGEDNEIMVGYNSGMLFVYMNILEAADVKLNISKKVVKKLDEKYLPYNLFENSTIFEELTIDGFSAEDSIYVTEFDPTLELIKDYSYIVEWDGVEYECVCYDDEGVLLLGNTNYSMGIAEGDIPFCVIVDTTYQNAYLATESSESSHTISIKAKKINENLLVKDCFIINITKDEEDNYIADKKGVEIVKALMTNKIMMCTYEGIHYYFNEYSSAMDTRMWTFINLPEQQNNDSEGAYIIKQFNFSNTLNSNEGDWEYLERKVPSLDTIRYMMYSDSSFLQLSTEDKTIVGAINEVNTKASTQSDWNVNDETDPAYVKNRTHYVKTEPITETREFIATDRFGGSITDLEFANILVDNCETATYVCTGFNKNPQFISITDTSETVKRIVVKFPAGGTMYVDVDLSTGKIQFGDGGQGMFSGGSIIVPYNKETIIQLNEKFIPDTIARTIDVDTSLESTLEEAKTYTDEQINAAKIVATITMKFVPGTGFVTTCDTSFANMWAANEEGKTVLIKYNNYLTHANMITEDSGEKQIFVVIPDAYGNTNYFTIKEDESVIFDSANFIANNELKQTTGTDTASSISVMSQKAVTDALALKSDTNHTHTIEDVENLQTTLNEINEKANESSTFIINITENEDDEGNFTYSADKTFDEIIEAHENGRVVMARYYDVFINITTISDTEISFKYNSTEHLTQEIMECYIYNDNTIEFFNELLSIEEVMGSNSLSTTNKTIVGAINELNELKADKNDLIGASYNELGEIFNDYVNNIASGVLSHAEGASTTALGSNSHAEGESTTALAQDSHAEGYLTGASGYCSHAEGLSYNKYPNTIKASSSKDEVITAWDKTKFSLAHGEASHVEGVNTLAAGMFSHAEGECTIATTKASHVQGKYNTKDTENKYAHIVGNGESYNIRSNAHTLDWEGNAEFQGDVKANACGGATPISLVELYNTIQTLTTRIEALESQLAAQTAETWTFTLEDGTTTTKNIATEE